MKQAANAQDLAAEIAALKSSGARLALVPTMGALHEGHLSLMRLARQHADKVMVSIFVNPTQFAPQEDFAAYPRNPDRDLELLEAENIDLVYTPSAVDIYPNGAHAQNDQALPAETGLESDFRPHFFAGVKTVVRILFDQCTPDIAVFGEKDFQQLQVIREMIAADQRPLKIIGGPIIRDEHGLALSSRNAYLSAEELAIARQLNKILKDTARDDKKQALLNAGFTTIDYVEERWNRVLAAAWIGKTRLIDNMPLRIE